jgi:hypothetical protein
LDELSEKKQGRDVREYPQLPLILPHNDFVWRTFWQYELDTSNKNWGEERER